MCQLGLGKVEKHSIKEMSPIQSWHAVGAQ